MERMPRALVAILVATAMLVGCGRGKTKDAAKTGPEARPPARPVGTAGSAPTHISGPFLKADRIQVLYAPDANFTGAKVKTFEIKDPNVIKKWLDVLSKIPRTAPNAIKAKLRADAPEFRIEFHQGTTKLGALRMKAGKLDSPGGAGWDFYGDNEDKEFTALVKGLLTPAPAR